MSSLLPLVTLLTPTGDRPSAWELCQRYVDRFTYPHGRIQWIIASDGHLPTLISGEIFSGGFESVVLLNRQPGATGEITQAANLLAMIPRVTGTVVAVIEDDDWYAPGWIETCVRRLESSDICGEVCTTYYNVARRDYRANSNMKHASLFQTAFRSDMLPLFAEICRDGPRFIDMRLWERAKAARARLRIDPPSGQAIGIKGMPGRPGIGCGHTDPLEQLDPHLFRLRQWIGEDADSYERFATCHRTAIG